MVHHSHAPFKARLPSSWRLGSQRGYFALLEHPFKGRDATQDCETPWAEEGTIAMSMELFATGATIQENKGTVD